jgi:hypothetical protein
MRRLVLLITQSQQMALRDVLIDLIQGVARGMPGAPEVFVDCSTSPPTETTPYDLLKLLDTARPEHVPAPVSPGTPCRILNKEERRVVTEALRLAAAETRKAKSTAVADSRFTFTSKQTAHIDQLSRLAGTQDRLAAELAELDIRLERSLS